MQGTSSSYHDQITAAVVSPRGLELSPELAHFSVCKEPLLPLYFPFMPYVANSSTKQAPFKKKPSCFVSNLRHRPPSRLCIQKATSTGNDSSGEIPLNQILKQVKTRPIVSKVRLVFLYNRNLMKGNVAWRYSQPAT